MKGQVGWENLLHTTELHIEEPITQDKENSNLFNWDFEEPGPKPPKEII